MTSSKSTLDEKKEDSTYNQIIEDVKLEETDENGIGNNKKKKSKKIFVILIVFAIFLILISVFSTIFALINITNTKILHGISLNGTDIGGLTQEQAKEKLKEKLSSNLEKDINLTYKDFSTSINPAQIDFTYYIEDAVKDAYEIARNGNIIKNNYEIINTFINNKNIEIHFTYNSIALKSLIEDMEKNLPDAIKQYSYYIENETLYITPGVEGAVIQKDRLKTLIIESIQNETEEEKQLTIPVQIMQPDEIDIEKIHSEIYTEPKDAYYTKDPFVIYPHVNGVDFNISIDEAKQILQEKKDTYEIKLKYTTPSFTQDQIGTEAFPDLLSSFNTKYDVTNRNRSTNLQLAANKINGTVLMPGEEFSYNKVVGERTISAGYKEAKIYSNGQIIDGLGGGICQISSTLYNSALLANLEITERRNHQFKTSYLAAGLDATVVYGSTDFKFKNTRKYPIKIVSEVKNGVAKIDIYGVKEEMEYEIRIEPVIINYITYSTSYINDSSLAPGQQVVSQKGVNGIKTITYKYEMLNGNIIDKKIISRDTYNPMQKIVKIGV